MTDTDPASVLDGIVHAETQAAGDGFDLTVARIHEIATAGEVDFGGGELAIPNTQPIDSVKRDQIDEYGWWNLSPDTYLLEFNETLPSASSRFLLQPRQALLACGATHPARWVTTLDPVPLTVSDPGLHLKENARVSQLLTP